MEGHAYYWNKSERSNNKSIILWIFASTGRTSGIEDKNNFPRLYEGQWFCWKILEETRPDL